MIPVAETPARGMHRIATGRAGTGGSGPVTVHRLHMALTLLATAGVGVGTRSVWNQSVVNHPGFAVALSLSYLVMLVAAALTLCARTSGQLMRIDVGVLATTIAVKVIAIWPYVTRERAIGVDEGQFMDKAARALAAGHNPYLARWPHLDPMRPSVPTLPTPLLNGHIVTDFGYPPFGAELGAVVQKVSHSYSGVVILSLLALVATTLIVYAVAPAPLRPLVTLGLLGLGTLTTYAQSAYPSLIALPFLCVALCRWTSIGRGGRLGRSGLVRAGALGLALCTHQLGWFVAVFLVVGLWLLRRGELSARAAAWLLIRYVATVAGTALLVTLPFLLSSPRALATQVLEPLTQHAVPHGQGLMDIPVYLFGGSDRLGYYGYASMLLLVALLVLYAARIRVLGPAVVVLPWLCFMVSTRSQDGYFILTMPLWIVGFATTHLADFETAHRLTAPAWLRRAGRGQPARRIRVVAHLATAALFVPAVACAAVATASPPPLALRVRTPVTTGHPIRTLTVTAANRSAHAITPHFQATTTEVDVTQFWQIVSGPASLLPHHRAVYVLRPPGTSWKPADTSFLWAVSDHPQTLSKIRIPVGR